MLRIDKFLPDDFELDEAVIWCDDAIDAVTGETLVRRGEMGRILAKDGRDRVTVRSVRVGGAVVDIVVGLPLSDLIRAAADDGDVQRLAREDRGGANGIIRPWDAESIGMYTRAHRPAPVAPGP